MAQSLSLCLPQFLDGATLAGIMALNKVTRKAIADETHIYTVDNPKFIHGDGASVVIVLPDFMPGCPFAECMLATECKLRTCEHYDCWPPQASRRWCEVRGQGCEHQR